MTEKQRKYLESRKHCWTDAELAYLRAHYADTACSDMKDVLRLSENSIAKKAKELGLKKSSDFRKRMNNRYVRGYHDERYKNYNIA